MNGTRREAIAFEASLLLAAFFLGTNPVAVKYVVAHVPPLFFVALRFTLAGALLWLVLRFVKPEGRPRGRDLWEMAAVGAAGVGLNNTLFTLGVSMTSASETALIYATPPLWGMLLGFVLGLERPALKGVLGVALALLGVAVVVSGSLGNGGSSLSGDLLVMGGAICWGSYTVLGMRLLRRYPPLAVASYTTFFGGLVVSPIALWELANIHGVSTEWSVWSAFAYSAVLVAAYGFFAWQRGVSRLGANQVLVYQYLVTLIGVASGVVLLGEALTVNKILGGAIILAGVYLARRQ